MTFIIIMNRVVSDGTVCRLLRDRKASTQIHYIDRPNTLSALNRQYVI